MWARRSVQPRGLMRFAAVMPCPNPQRQIMRRILGALAAGQEVTGDTSTLEDRSVLDPAAGLNSDGPAADHLGQLTDDLHPFRVIRPVPRRCVSACTGWGEVVYLAAAALRCCSAAVAQVLEAGHRSDRLIRPGNAPPGCALLKGAGDQVQGLRRRWTELGFNPQSWGDLSQQGDRTVRLGNC